LSETCESKEPGIFANRITSPQVENRSEKQGHHETAAANTPHPEVFPASLQAIDVVRQTPAETIAFVLTNNSILCRLIVCINNYWPQHSGRLGDMNQSPVFEA